MTDQPIPSLRGLIADALTHCPDTSTWDAMAGAALDAILGPIPAGTDTATWTAVRAIQLMNEAGQQRVAAQAVIERVRALHQRDGDHCAVCTEDFGRLQAEWPCPTIRALDEPTPEATEATVGGESPGEPWTQLEARAFNAVQPALREAGQWLPLSARRKVARAILAELGPELAAVERVRALETLPLDGLNDLGRAQANGWNAALHAVRGAPTPPADALSDTAKEA
jgi:hypothetical protein